METTLGGERLGSGNKQKIHMKNYDRSTHELSYIWRSTMSAGTLVPFMTEVALPGDTFDINLNCDGLTHPTNGPLFGSYKMQLDVFQIPIRLYQAQLHMNKLGIGMNMANIKLPQLEILGKPIDTTKPIDNQQINPSSILSYLNIRGLGNVPDEQIDRYIRRQFNAIPYLGYWEIYKNYYANKQEEIGAVIHSPTNQTPLITFFTIEGVSETYVILHNTAVFTAQLNTASKAIISMTNLKPDFNIDEIKLLYDGVYRKMTEIFLTWNINTEEQYIEGTQPRLNLTPLMGNYNYTINDNYDTEPIIKTFPLSNIDDMREQILTHTSNTPFLLQGDAIEPYNLPLKYNYTSGTLSNVTALNNQEGLALKTYQSDLFNNWISTEWIDGDNGINQITAIDVSDGSFTIDELNMSNKIYNMLNRIALSGGTYDDWLDAVYDHERFRNTESPIYLGGLIKELVFQEVISNSATTNEPLGSLAGRGVLGKKHKGGKITVRIHEPSYIMGIVSLTPRIDYSQGNKWDTNLKTMDDFHKPALDEIGFQDLITDQMAWFDTIGDYEGKLTLKSAGKQPAWINYMTNVNQIRGNFADDAQQMYMILNRRYEHEPTNSESSTVKIKDLTTYIDPAKFNYIFADARRDAQNFWIQIGLDITARRKMSAKVIPNL